MIYGVFYPRSPPLLVLSFLYPSTVFYEIFSHYIIPLQIQLLQLLLSIIFQFRTLFNVGYSDIVSLT